MFLVAGPNPDFLRFIQILCWISLPVLLTAVLITVFLHYRNKKKKNTKPVSEVPQEPGLAFPRQVGYTNGNGEYVLFDHSDLMRQYRNLLSYNQARFTALQYDFTAIENKYEALAKYAQTHFLTLKKTPMENLHDQLPKHLEADVNKLAEQDAIERRELMSRLSQMEKSFNRLEQENRLLKEQQTLQTATDDQKIAIINKWKEENASLRQRIEEQDYLQDLVEEKKAQIQFLQTQAEQRIKNLYQSEHQRLQTVAEVKQLKEEKESIWKNITALQDELLLKQEQIDKTQVLLCEKEEKINEKDQTLNAKLEQIVTLENLLRDAREQHEQLNAALADNKGLAAGLQAQLSDEQSKVQFLTEKVFANKQALRRMQKEFSDLIEDAGNEESLVIPLRPEYGNQENGEIAAQ